MRKLLFTSFLGFTYPCFFEVIEEILGVVVEVASDLFVALDNVSNWNKSECKQFSHIQTKRLIFVVFLREPFILDMTPNALTEVEVTS